MNTKNEAEAQIVAVMLQADGRRCDLGYLEQHLDHIPPQELRELVEALAASRTITERDTAGNVVEIANELQEAEALAAVVLHVLVTERRAMTADEVAVDVERDPSKPDECAEVDAALRLLELSELAMTADDGRWLPTLAACRADELSF